MSRARARRLVRQLAGRIFGLTILAASTVIAPDAMAGGFAVHEQSVVGQGASYAGVAAGGALSSMFWNPATITQQSGKSMENGFSGIISKTSQSGVGGGGLLTASASNTAKNALVPSGYSSWQLNDRFWVGMGTNGAYGVAAEFPKTWAGAAYAQDSQMKSYNFNPVAAMKVTDWLSVGLGLQIQYMDIRFENFQGAAVSNLRLEGNGWGFGFTAGATFTPFRGTQIGIGYRSAIDQDLKGDMTNGIGLATNGGIKATVKLPDIVTVGLRQRVGERATVMAGVEWTNWSRIGGVAVTQATGAAALGPTGAAILLPFNYRDSAMYSLGVEYALRDDLTLRAGFAYESTPIPESVRTPRLPDSDRYWYSIGSSYRVPQFPGMIFDLAYTYIDVAAAPITITAASGNPWFSAAAGAYTGTADSSSHIVSFAVRYQWGGPVFAAK
jgi:long-chain fatty acid transport protein